MGRELRRAVSPTFTAKPPSPAYAGLFDYAYVVAFYLPLADSDRNLHVSFFNFVKVDTYIKLLPVALF